MSGGYFEGNQYMLGQIVDQIEDIIYKNDSIELNAWGDKIGYGFSEKTIEEFKNATQLIKIAEIYATRIDWLLSGDDGEETFHKRLKENLSNVVYELDTKVN